MRLDQYESTFKMWLLSDDLTPETVRNFITQFREFSVFCNYKGVTIGDLQVNVAREYMVHLLDRPNQHTGKPLSAGTRAKHYYFLKRLDKYLNEHGMISKSIVQGIRPPRRRQAVIQGFSAEQLQAIINAVRDLRTSPYYKDRTGLLIYFLASTGLRIGEALNVRVNSFDHIRRIVLVLGKGDREREVPYSREVSALVQKYIEKYQIGREDLLFASRYGRPLAQSTVRDVLRKAAKMLGSQLDIDRMRVSPHTFRHTFARLWVIKGGNTIALSRIMGHTSTSMTDKYVRLWGIDLNQSYDLCNPCSDIEPPSFD